MPVQPHEQHTLSMRSQRRLFRVLHAVARRPRTTLLAMLVAVAPLAVAGSGLTPDNSLAVWFVQDDPALAGYRAFQREFGNDEVVAVSYRAPAGALDPAQAQVQRRAAARLRAVDGIDQVLAPALLADSLGTGPQARAFLWKSGLVSRDARTVTLLARVSARPDIDEVRGDILDSVRVAVRQALTDDRPAHFAGIGVVYDALNRQTIKDSGFYLGVAFVVMGGLLWLALRRWRSVAIALVPPVVVSIMTTGLFVLTDQPFTQVTSILPMLVLVIGLSDAIHLVTHYYAERRAHGAVIGLAERREMVARGAAWVALPNLFTALTTAAGFVALASSRMPAIRDLGLFAGIAMLVLWVMTLLVGTAALSLWDVPPPPERPQGGRLDHALAWLSIHVPRWRWAVLGSMTALTAFLLVGAARVRADTYTLELLPPDHVAVADSRWIEANAGNYTPLEFIVRARERGVDPLRAPAVLHPDVLRAVAEWQRRAEARPDVDRTFGVADLAAAGRAVPGGGYVSADGREGRVTAFVPMTSTRGFTGTVRELQAEGARILGPAATV
ncbi:MAG TPA: MMPL family transporter, partial [Longimicrobium sp.]